MDGGGAGPPSPPTPRSWSPRWPTGGSSRRRPSSRRPTGRPELDWQANPDILAGLAADPRRPRLLVGFAAETGGIEAEAAAKRARKGCDWILANDVSGDVMGGDTNRIHFIGGDGAEDWEPMSKAEVARRLAERIADALG